MHHALTATQVSDVKSPNSNRKQQVRIDQMCKPLSFGKKPIEAISKPQKVMQTQLRACSSLMLKRLTKHGVLDFINEFIWSSKSNYPRMNVCSTIKQKQHTDVLITTI